MSYLTNLNNVNNVREQIAMNNLNTPFHATVNYAKATLTDYDTFPYPRWFRGVPQSSKPIIAEREAGWRTRHDNCYKVLNAESDNEWKYPDHCFEGPCSLVVPCYPAYLQKLSDKEALNVILNKACIVQYR